MCYLAKIFDKFGPQVIPQSNLRNLRQLFWVDFFVERHFDHVYGWHADKGIHQKKGN